MAYSEKVLEHYNHPATWAPLDKTSPDVGTGMWARRNAAT